MEMGMGGIQSLVSLPSGDNINDQADSVPGAEPIAAKPKRKKRVNTTSVCISMVIFRAKNLISISLDSKNGFSIARAL